MANQAVALGWRIDALRAVIRDSHVAGMKPCQRSVVIERGIGGVGEGDGEGMVYRHRYGSMVSALSTRGLCNVSSESQSSMSSVSKRRWCSEAWVVCDGSAAVRSGASVVGKAVWVGG